MNAIQKTLGQVIDELCTVSQKLFKAQDEICGGGNDAEVAAAARKAQSLNAKRTALIRAIDEYAGISEGSPTEKTYK